MTDLYPQLKEVAGDMDEAEFTRRHPGTYYFCQMPESQPSPIPFVTQIHTLSPNGEVAPEPDLPAAPERIFRIEKSLRNSWRGRISVGRAKNNDIVIRHSSISKLHAHFSEAPKGDALPGEEPIHLLTDAGSSNGTEVNDTVLTADEPAPVRNRDRVVFGFISGRILDASALHAELCARDWF